MIDRRDTPGGEPRSGVADATGTSGLSDDDVVTRVRSGETALFELLMRRHNQRVYRVVRGLIADDDEASDVVQDAWVRAWQYLDQFAGRAAFSTWVCRIALHEAWSRLRKRRRFVALPAIPFEGDEEGQMSIADRVDEPGTPADLRYLAHLLQGAVDRLPPPLRIVFVLRETEGLSVAETASLLEISEENVKGRLHRARATLRREIESHVGDETRRLYGFDGARCNAVVAGVMARIAKAPRQHET